MTIHSCGWMFFIPVFTLFSIPSLEALAVSSDALPFPDSLLKRKDPSANLLAKMEKLSLSELLEKGSSATSVPFLAASGLGSSLGSLPSLFDSLDANTKVQFFRESLAKIEAYEYPGIDTRKLSPTEKAQLARIQKKLLLYPQLDFDQAVRAFLGGGDLSRFKIFGHHWDIKAAQISVVGNRVVMDGTLIHNSRLGMSHEISYELVFVNGKPSFEINSGERTNYWGLVLKPLSLFTKFCAALLLKGDFREFELRREGQLLTREYQKERSSIDGSLAANLAKRLQALQDQHGQDQSYLADKRILFLRKQYFEMLTDVFDEMVGDLNKYNQESFKKTPDWEKQGIRFIKRLASAAWERVALMGISFEDLPLLFSDPSFPAEVNFTRDFQRYPNESKELVKAA